MASPFTLLELVEEAFERAGLEPRTARDFRTVRRSLGFIAAEWANRGLNLFTVEQIDIPVVPGVVDYPMPPDTVDVVEQSVRLGQTDYPLERTTFSDYEHLPNKSIGGRPLQVLVRRTTIPSLTLWPVPDAPAILRVWRMRRIGSAGTGSDTVDVPFRFIPALVAGLAYHVAMKRPEAAPRIADLKASYDEQFQMAWEEDRDRASVRFTPWVGY